jgi:transcriptional regulator with XRE-family HTH domain
MRDRRRISKVADMARVLDVDPGTLFRIRRGSSVPKLDLLIKMAEVAGMSLDVLVGRRPAPRQRKAGM